MVAKLLLAGRVKLDRGWSGRVDEVPVPLGAGALVFGAGVLSFGAAVLVAAGVVEF
jgi:hypothetical protein